MTFRTQLSAHDLFDQLRGDCEQLCQGVDLALDLATACHGINASAEKVGDLFGDVPQAAGVEDEEDEDEDEDDEDLDDEDLDDEDLDEDLDDEDLDDGDEDDDEEDDDEDDEV